mmetsp:Transcript_34122/g.42152  ORF Transcript_34122/g.42152 Transcript_34122/m.42152 type:complete len:93 (-) Transcript_34122:651-929(-)|eukprot:CAMPEP_0204823208 /NCGR_PEP_ID=MMETSP1346-20131115/1296_1 /ASSEMBLY_ACC=CAM_ASM_000771 /TAXON_ID=215587 /ORGANISM="Aplanochytrium stocchinoi, Strain GSBS06" /LENGTH=92 /DNA_ID=CAMNT_0051949759 /DNA_START=433 /DNA_END=711 /DNA_ORIENTATION=+
MAAPTLRITKPTPDSNPGIDFTEISGGSTPSFTPKVLSLRNGLDRKGEISPRKPAVKNVRGEEASMKWPSLMMKRRRKRFDSADYELEKMQL